MKGHHPFLLPGQQSDLWMNALSFLDIPDLCKVEALTHWHRNLVSEQFKRLEEDYDRGEVGRSSAWTVKQRVCRLYAARRKHRSQCHRRTSTGIFDGVYANDSRTDIAAVGASVRCNGCCSHPLFQPDNYLVLEYFVVIARNDNVVWDGFLPSSCSGIRLDSLQRQILYGDKVKSSDDDDDDDGWKEWRELFQLLSQHQDEFKPDQLSDQLQSSIRAVRRNYSIRVFGMDVFSKDYQAHQIMDANPDSQHLALHFDDSAYYQDEASAYYKSLMRRQQEQATAASARRENRTEPDDDDRPLLHMWIRMAPSSMAVDGPRLTELRIDKCCHPDQQLAACI